MTLTADPKENYLAQFETGGNIAGGPSWLPPLRRAALSRFAELGFPKRLDEEWRFTQIAPIAEIPFQPASAGAASVTPEQIAPFTFGDDLAAQLVFVNGHYAPGLSTINDLPDGITVGSLADALAANAAVLESNLGRHATFDRAPFVALNTAFLQDGAVVTIRRGAALGRDLPIHLLFVSTGVSATNNQGAANGSESASGSDGPTVSHPRVLIVAEENSEATIVESYVGVDSGTYFTNAVTEVSVANDARLDHYKVQRESLNAFHVATMQIAMGQGSVFSSHSIVLGGQIVRNDVNAVLNGEHAECTLNGVNIGTGKRVLDNHTSIDHASPNCASHELYKNILDGESKGVFNGKIYVRLDAQKTDAKQTNQTLLLSPDAQINTKPQLEILADDVKCTHGATIGQLDRNALFYLRARGIGEAEGRAMLTYAFAGEIVHRIKVDAVRQQLDDVLLAQLPRP